MITLGNYTGFMRSEIRDGCTGKKRYEDLNHAQREIENLTRNNAHRPALGPLTPYVCGRCCGIHIGHSNFKQTA